MGFESLEVQRTNALNILALINISIPHIAFRHYRFLVANFHRTNYGSFEPINNMMRLFNTTYDIYDFIATRSSIRRAIRSVKI